MADYSFLITPHPTHRNLKLAIGGSAHGYKFFPVLGKYIVEMMEDILDPAIAQKWRWRPGLKDDHDSSPHFVELKDINSFPGWRPTG